MRLKSVYISEYKNLKDFTINFEQDNFIDIFVGRNGSGKSNFFEAVILIFKHLYEYNSGNKKKIFNYSIAYELKGHNYSFEWTENNNRLNRSHRSKNLNEVLPDNIVIYYSGHNNVVSNVVSNYLSRFKRRLNKAEADLHFTDTVLRQFIGISPDYKKLIIALLLLLPESNLTRTKVCSMLNITTQVDAIDIKLKKPFKHISTSEFEEFNPKTYFWGIGGIVREFVEKLTNCVRGEFRHEDLYDKNSKKYRLEIDYKLYNKYFYGVELESQFKLFDALKTFGILNKIDIKVSFENGDNASTLNFSDGQFQTVYILALLEIFKNSNCLILLDEPDSFLHPEWQYDFIKQTLVINHKISTTNHVLLSSHSAVTLIPHQNSRVHFFELKQSRIICNLIPKRVAVSKLSTKIITYSEQHSLLSILNTIQNSDKPILFTEGSTDPIILSEAWYKLYGKEIPFIPFYAFSCGYLKQLLTDERIHIEMKGKPIFGLFDFDEAFNQWNDLNGTIEVDNYFDGRIKKWNSGNAYAILMPIPPNEVIQKQIIKTNPPLETYKNESKCEIEHLFYGIEGLEKFYKEASAKGGGKIIEFISDGQKTSFAKDVIPTIEPSHFEVFRPMFEFIVAKC